MSGVEFSRLTKRTAVQMADVVWLFYDVSVRKGTLMPTNLTGGEEGTDVGGMMVGTPPP